MGQSPPVVLALIIPFTTGWMGGNHFTAVPTAPYGVVLLMAAFAYLLLQQTIIRATRKGLGSEESDRARLEGQTINCLVCRSNCYSVSFLMDSPGDPRDRRTDMTGSGPPYRKAAHRG